MKLCKLKRISALALIVIMLLAFTGCNYINRPDGAKNNSADNNNRIAKLLVKDIEVTNTTITEEQTGGGPIEYPDDEEPEPEPEQKQGGDEEEKKSYDTPFCAPGDVISKINAILGSIATETEEVSSATGVKDELMTSRTVNMYMPHKLFDNQDDVIDSIAGNLNMNIRSDIVSTDYVAAVKRSVLAGGKADLMYVDQQSWGYTQHFTQDITKFVNFDIGDKLNTYTSYLSNKFLVEASNVRKSYVASGIGAPYMLVYNPDNLVVPENAVIPENPEEGMSEIEIIDPKEMYASGTWGISAFTEILKASTKSGRIGLASIIDDDDNLDIWGGMENNASLTVDFDTLIASVDTSILSRECLDTLGDNMDKVQSWYWSELGNDKSNYVASFTSAGDYNNTVKKMLGVYDGDDPVTGYTFLTAEASEFKALKQQADLSGKTIDFIPFPYGAATENYIRTTTYDEEGRMYDGNGYEIRTYAAGWAGGFSVLKNCENPAVALRAGEEITKAWQENYEKPILDTMTDDQKARYESMKQNLGISFYRSVINNAETAYDTYGTDVADRLISETRNLYGALQMFSDAPGVLMQPIYRKNTTLGIYEANSFTKWSEFYYGRTDPTDGKSKLSNSLLPILSTGFLPPSMLFIY